MSNTLPVTIAGRSFFDPIRLRWGGLGSVGLGVLLLFQGPAGIIFGLLFLALGVLTWTLTSFGAVSWNELSGNSKAVTGTGSVVGNVFLLVFLGGIIVTCWIIKYIADNW